MSTATKQRTTKAARRSADRYTIWKAMGFAETFYGFMVTESGNPHRLVALVCCDEDNDCEERERALAQACWIAQDPTLAGRSFDQPCIDLRHYGRSDSVAPMPGFAYALRLYPFGEDREALDVEPVEPMPFCKFRLAAMQRQAKAI